jgi:hypothetical protein
VKFRLHNKNVVLSVILLEIKKILRYGMLLGRQSRSFGFQQSTGSIGGKYDAVRLPAYNNILSTLNGLIFGKYPLLETIKQNRKK